jgi:hypothetical protein
VAKPRVSCPIPLVPQALPSSNRSSSPASSCPAPLPRVDFAPLPRVIPSSQLQSQPTRANAHPSVPVPPAFLPVVPPPPVPPPVPSITCPTTTPNTCPKTCPSTCPYTCPYTCPSTCPNTTPNATPNPVQLSSMAGSDNKFDVSVGAWKVRYSRLAVHAFMYVLLAFSRPVPTMCSLDLARRSLFFFPFTNNIYRGYTLTRVGLSLYASYLLLVISSFD